MGCLETMLGRGDGFFALMPGGLCCATIRVGLVRQRKEVDMSNRKLKNRARIRSQGHVKRASAGKPIRHVSDRQPIERGEQLPVQIGIIPGTATPERLHALFESWRNEDAEEQRETLEYLKQALDEDRLSSRPLFPKRDITQ
jgi:hypothetical protein